MEMEMEKLKEAKGQDKTEVCCSFVGPEEL